MKVFTEKVGGKYCPSFQFHNQTFRLQGFETKEESEWMEKQLKVCFSNYGLLISRKITDKLLSEAINNMNEIMEKISG